MAQSEQRPHGAARDSIMELLQMHGSYPLTDEAIDEQVTRTSPGNYALGYMCGSTFMVCYLGRSDSDVGGQLHGWVDAPSRDRYPPACKAAWASRRGGPMPLGAPAVGQVGLADGSYTRFAYSYALSAQAAFERECRNYEDFGEMGALDNEAQPVPTPAEDVRRE